MMLQLDSIGFPLRIQLELQPSIGGMQAVYWNSLLVLPQTCACTCGVWVLRS